MIARLTGRCVHSDSESIVVDVGGVGYLVRATTGVVQAAQRSPESVTVHVHTSVREDAIQLFGFASHVEQLVFERLVQLQGVGPKVAIGVLSSITPQDLQRATLQEDVALLQSVPGVGPKVARRIVTELRDKLEDIVPSGVTTFSAQVADGSAPADSVATFYEAREALVGLGMAIPEAEAALAETDEGADAGERVRQALATRKRRVRS
ncbi:MAG: Holliday junction ATP-dependent helicase RuvA [Thermoleophilia bacterium]|nr:Holliday junction ATP-dependent helicase RuvA [Thermoleophilia bacterium]